MVYLVQLYVYLFLRKPHIKCGPAANRLGWRIFFKMVEQLALWWYNTQQANTVRAFTAILKTTSLEDSKKADNIPLW